VLVDQSERSVLELSGQDTLAKKKRNGHTKGNAKSASNLTTHTRLTTGERVTNLPMAVRDLLDLQRSLQASSELVAPPHDEQTLLLRERIPGELLEGLVLLEDAGDLHGEVVEAVDDGLSSLEVAEGVVRELDGHHDKSLGRGEENMVRGG
jgi:hypothetical protein